MQRHPAGSQTIKPVQADSDASEKLGVAKLGIEEQIEILAGVIAYYNLPELLSPLRTLQWVRDNEAKIKHRCGI